MVMCNPRGAGPERYYEDMNHKQEFPDLVESRQFFQDQLSVEPMPGGITNRNYRVETPSGFLVARICRELPLLGIDRRNEQTCQSIAAGLGLAPEIVHQEQDLLVSRYVAGRTLTAAQFEDSRVIGRVAATLGRLHEGWDAMIGQVLYFCPFQTIRTYARTATELRANVPADFEELVEHSRLLSHRTGAFRPVLCHNDLLPANLIDSGERLWVVDWEYSGMGNPLFDLASLSANAGFSHRQDVALLEAYRGEVHANDLHCLSVLKAASSLREALWAVIQSVISDLSFDYQAYAHQHFQAYREAGRQLST